MERLAFNEMTVYPFHLKAVFVSKTELYLYFPSSSIYSWALLEELKINCTTNESLLIVL